MRGKILSSLLLVTSVSLGSAAFAAASQTVGTIKTVDAKNMAVILQDGTTYSLPKGAKPNAFKVGEKVTVTWEMQGKKHVATAIAPAS